MTSTRRASLVALVVGFATSAPSALAADFGSPIVLQAPSPSFVGTPALAVASSGRVVVAWDQQLSATGPYGIVARRGTTAGGFGAPERVTTAGYGPAVAAGPSGGAAAIWTTFASGGTRRVEVSTAVGRGRFGTPHVLSSVKAGVGADQIVASGDHYVALWVQGVPATGGHALLFSVSDAAGRFGGVRMLAPDVGPASNFKAAAAADGTVSAAWAAPATAPGPQEPSFAQLVPGAAAFGPAGAVSSTSAGAGLGAIGVTAGPGATVLTWLEAGNPELVRTALLAPGVPPVAETAFALTTSDPSNLYVAGPVGAVPAAGLGGVAAWAVIHGVGGESGALTGASVFAAGARADGSYGDATQLSAPAELAIRPVAAASHADAVIAWAATAGRYFDLRYAVRSGSGAFGPERRLTAAGHAENSEVLASSPGAVVAAWISRPGPGTAQTRGTRRGVAVAILRDAG